MTSSSSSSSSSSFGSLFRSSFSSPDGFATTGTSGRDTRTIPKLKVTKPTATKMISPSFSPDQDTSKRPSFLSFLFSGESSSYSSSSSSDSSSSASYSSMLLPPRALFPSLSGTTPAPATAPLTKSPKAKRGLFRKTKRHSKNTIATPGYSSEERSTGWSLRPWASWGGGGGAEGGLGEGASPSKNDSRSHGRIWASKTSKSDTDVVMIQHQQQLVDNTKKKKKKSGMFAGESCNSEVGAGAGQIMLHPSYNLSNRSITSMYSSSPPSDHEALATTGYQQHSHSCLDQVCHHCQHQQGSSRMGVTLAVHDVFGIGKVTEMSLALFLAHDAFLSRRPFWMQCAVMGWEALVVLLALWGVLRVVGLVEAVVWGANDIVRGTVSTIQALGRALQFLLLR
ncbi:hypothetical protein BC939DRAFT_467784 [Gamsiella multidivaricata]|uniref:uncharacterized protein n=1 Tax=Gamsiella multidivaricata TaxID=101098 RepID=UPI0022202BDD|nr:uncharacterized protein BC939DRAFT_467784 [Gamsiella multidivaricata]KAI7816813.1 hypothetical protein BC939DRAFT_467784 [Gamsiella multidivaricata]